MPPPSSRRRSSRSSAATRPPRSRARSSRSTAGRDVAAEPLEVLYEAPGLPAFDLPEELAAAVRRHARVRGAAGVRELRRERGRRRRRSRRCPRSNRLIAAGSASRPLRDGPPAGVRGRDRDRLGDAAASPRGGLDAGAGLPAGRGRRSPSCARGSGCRPSSRSSCSPRAARSTPSTPRFAAGALVLTTDEGAARLGRRPARGAVVSPGPGARSRRASLDALRARGHRLILSEGGPTRPRLASSRPRLVDELFLTVSPLLIGRTGDDQRLALVEERRPARRRTARGQAARRAPRRRPPLPSLRARHQSRDNPDRTRSTRT